MGVTNTERPDRASTTTTRRCRAMGSSDKAAKASVPPRTGSITSPGAPAGMDTVTRPTLPPSGASLDAGRRRVPGRYLSRRMILAVKVAADLANERRASYAGPASGHLGKLREFIYSND